MYFYVIKIIRKKHLPVIEVTASNWVDGSLETFQLMKEGRPIIIQGFLVNHNNKTKGRPDILIRSDYINKLKPGLLTPDEESIPSNFGPWHYRINQIIQIFDTK